MLVSVCLGAFWGLLLAGRLLSPYGMQDILHLWQVQFGRSGSTWTPKVCKIMALMAVVMGLGLLFYILLVFR